MKRPFLGGLLAGILTPFLFLGAAMLFTYRATGKVPFATEGSEDQVTIKLIEPDQVPEAWEPWGERLTALIARLEALGDDEPAS